MSGLALAAEIKSYHLYITGSLNGSQVITKLKHHIWIASHVLKVVV